MPSPDRSLARPLHRWFAFWALCYGISLVNTGLFLRGMVWDQAGNALFNLSLLVTYALIYLLPALGLTSLARGALALGSGHLRPGFASGLRGAVVALAWAAASLTQVLLYADRQVYSVFGLHFNGFVWNLLSTPGGIDSMGSSQAAKRVYAATVVGFFLAHGVALLVADRWARWQDLCARLCTRRRAVALCAVFLTLGLGERITYGTCRLRGEASVAVSAQAIPLYQPLTFSALGRWLGLEAPNRGGSIRLRSAKGRLRYPLRPLAKRAVERPLNVVWLVCESLRADALNPEVMPRTWRFAARGRRFLNHYSGGNGTRMGMFTQFYGLYGSYWFSFLQERRGPVLIDRLIEQGYQFSLRTSMNFTYPEFDKTIFARIPKSELHEGVWGLSKWEADRLHVGKQIEFLRGRDRSRPFMLFQFFESPHAKYWFPPESVIRRPYLEEFNYATVDLEENIELLRSRYLNSCHHLDSQLGRLFDVLEDEGLLDSTVVILTGDHGEEFMEKGRWGHNSEFHQEQIRVPFVLFVPGQPPGETTRMTSHLDVPATLLPLLGVDSDPADYSQGTSLLAATGRKYTVVCDWDRVGYVGEEFKATMPLKVRGLFGQRVTDHEDEPLEDTARFFRARRTELGELLRELGRFRR